MFSCMSSLDTATGTDVTLDRVIEEAAKLKRKCKSLRMLLLETETKRSDERAEYESTIEDMKRELDTGLADLQAQKFLELSEMRDYRTNEVEELRLNLKTAQNEVSMQGALIIALTRKVTDLEREIDVKDASHRASFQQQQRALQEETARADLVRAPFPQSESLKRALLAEAEVSKLKCALSAQAQRGDSGRAVGSGDSPAPGKESGALQAAHNLLLAQKRKMEDELQYLREENARLERQVELMRADLEAQSQPHNQARPSPQYRQKESPQLRSDVQHFGTHAENPGALMEELRAARTQVKELKHTVQELVSTKAAVEQAVRGVLADNEALTEQVRDLTVQVQRLQAANKA